MAAPTSAQVLAALSIENTMHILYPTAPRNYSAFSDITDWTGLNISSGAGDTVKIIFQCTNSLGQVCYENTGFAAANFGSPDTTLTSLTTADFNLLTFTNTYIPVYGAYSFNLKVQVTPNGLSAFVVEKTFTVDLSANLAPTLSLEESWDCSVATYTSTDTTNYAAPTGYTLQTITLTHTVRPPLVAKKSDGTTAQPTVTANAQTILLGATNNPLWTGAYSASLGAVLTYKYGNNYYIVNVAAIEADAIVTCDNGLCELYCYLKKLYNQYFTLINAGATGPAILALQRWQMGFNVFALIQEALICATGDVASLTAKFYEVTGFTAGCECGCNDDPAPVVPTNVINGTNGADGLTPEFRVSGTLFQWKYTTDIGWTTLIDFSSIAGLNGSSFLQGSGAPGGGTGSNGDSYLDIVTYNLYLKTAGVWNLTGNIKGANGTNGTAVLYNQLASVVTAGTGWESVMTGHAAYTIPAATLTTNGSEVRFQGSYKSSANPASTQLVRVRFNGNDLNISTPFPAKNCTKIEFDGFITRVSNTTVRISLKTRFYNDYIAYGGGWWFNTEYEHPVASFGALDLTTNAYDIDFQANSDVAGDISLETASITLFIK
jgi:hypothetical protein